ncbi:MAG: hypothetical protein L3J39_00325 [Verrucomicrobiales bacterium]|nr:hypothetical protein [Verrucomicrobiales bacterium]
MSRKKKKSSKNSRRSRAKAAVTHTSKEKALADPKQLESLTQQAWDAGNFSRAREGYKRLHRLDPEKFEAQLIETSLLLANELEEKGLFLECGNILKDLPQFNKIPTANRANLIQLEQKCQLASPSRSKRLTAAATIIGAETEYDPDARSRAADVLVLEKDQLASDVNAAISALCSKNWIHLDLVLKKIIRQSPFREWRAFLAGCAAFHRGDKTLARKCFARLSEPSLPNRKANAYRAMLGDLDPRKDTEAQIELGFFLGHKDIFRHLLEADRQWKKNDLHFAHKSLSRINGFPGFKADFMGNLTRNFLNGRHGFSPNDQYQLTESSIHFYAANQKPGALAFFMAAPFLSSFGDGDDDYPQMLDIIAQQWKVYQKGFISFFGNSARFRSMCQLIQAKQSIASAGAGPSFFDIRPPDFSTGISLLKKAITSDPEFEEPHFFLLELYESAKNHSKRNKLLDVMSGRFPNSSKILRIAGRRCIERSSFKKAITFFERVEKLDPLDHSNQQDLYEANLKFAITHIANNKPHLLRPVLESLACYSQSTAGPVFYWDEFRIAFSDMAWKLTATEKDLEPPNLPAGDGKLRVSPHLYSFYSKLSWDYIYHSSSNKGKILPLADLIKTTKKDAVFFDATKMVQLLLQPNDLDLSKTTLDWASRYILLAIQNMDKKDLAEARRLGYTIAGKAPFLTPFAIPLAKKTKKLAPSDLFFQVYSAVVKKEFTPELDQAIKNFENQRTTDELLTALIKIYQNLRHEINPASGCGDDSCPHCSANKDDHFDFSFPGPSPREPNRQGFDFS